MSTLRCDSTATRSVMAYKVSRSCVTRNTVRPSASRKVRISLSKAAAPIGSSPAVGSSRNRMSGSSASARASAARLTMPPDRSDGYLAPASGGRPASAILSPASPAASRRDRPACSISGSVTFSATVSDENSAPCWNSTPKRRSMRLRCSLVSVVRSAPSTWMRPAAGRLSPAMVRSSTDLPVPEPPTTPRISPRRTSRSSPSCTTCGPKRFTRPRTSMTCSGALTSPSPCRTARQWHPPRSPRTAIAPPPRWCARLPTGRCLRP
jgi:hypothetical protein